MGSSCSEAGSSNYAAVATPFDCNPVDVEKTSSSRYSYNLQTKCDKFIDYERISICLKSNSDDDNESTTSSVKSRNIRTPKRQRMLPHHQGKTGRKAGSVSSTRTNPTGMVTFTPRIILTLSSIENFRSYAELYKVML